MCESQPWLIIWDTTLPESRHLVARLVSANNYGFATIVPHPDGKRYCVSLVPRGMDGPMTTFRTGSIPKAQAMIERWARSHWRSVRVLHRRR